MNTVSILAAGRGTRMGDLTSNVPKPMLPIRGKPLLEHMLDRLREAGFERALIVTGYYAEMIEEHFRGYPMEIGYRRQAVLNGTGTAALLAREFVGSSNFLLTHGDILASPEDYRGMVSVMQSEDGIDGVLGVKYVDDPWQGAAVYEAGGKISRIVEKPPRGGSTTHWNSAGLYVFTPLVFEELEAVPVSARGEYELTTAIDTMIKKNKDLRICSLQGDWLDVGRPDDLQRASQIV